MPKFGQVKCAPLVLPLHIRRRLLAALAVLAVAASGCSSYQPAPPPEQTPPTPAAAPRPVAEKITIAEDIFFDAGRSTLRPESVAKLDYLVKSVNEIKLEVVLVLGHADPREARGAAQALSEARASAVKTWMVSRGIDVNRVYTEGKGAQQPVGDNRTVEGRATNRRAEIEVIGNSHRGSPPAAPCPTDKMAKFPWPDPPQPTATDTISRASLLGTDHGKGKSMTDVAARLEAAVRKAGYVNPKLLGVGCDGFAMVLDLEHIQDDGTRMADAEGWAPPSQDEDEPGPVSVSAIKRLFYSPPGRYRQIVFVVSDRPMAQVTAAPTAAKLRTITKDAGHPLPDQFDAVPLTERHVLRVLVYEFAKPSAAKEAQVTPPPGRLGVLVHLKRARLI